MSPNCLQTLLWPIWLKTNVAIAVAVAVVLNLAID